MSAKKIIEVANVLNELTLNSEEKFWVRFSTTSKIKVFCELTHFSKEYENGNEEIIFYEDDTEAEWYEKIKLAKKVIAGECLIDETNSDISY